MEHENWKKVIDKFRLHNIIPDRLQELIDIMTRAKHHPFNMDVWQEIKRGRGKRCLTEDSLNDCGTAACVAGRLAVSPEFIRVGGRGNVYDGRPIIGESVGGYAIDHFLADHQHPRILESFGSYLAGLNKGLYTDKKLSDVTPDDVIDRLRYVQRSLPGATLIYKIRGK